MAERQRIALVTGGNRGIGLAICEGLAALGIKVLVGVRDLPSGRQAAHEIGHGADAVQIDLADAERVPARARDIDARIGGIDILVNNAGVVAEGEGIDVGESVLRHSLQVNALAPFQLIQALAPGMQTRGYGRIVNLSSGWGSFAEKLAGPVPYSVSKCMVNALTMTLSRGLTNNVKINSACPGWVRTRMGGENAERSVEQGADTPIWLATLPDDGPTGGFFRDRQPKAW